MKIYLARHGQTTGDLEDRYGGDYDDHLTDLGQQQSAELAKKLAGKNIEAIYCSPLMRARETAQKIKEQVPVAVSVMPNFKERNRYGILTGLTKQEAAQKFPDQVELLKDEHSVLQNGEDYESFGERIREGLKKVGTGKYKTAVVVTHGGPIRYIFREILGEGEIEVADCAYAEFSLQDGGLILLNINGIDFK